MDFKEALTELQKLEDLDPEVIKAIQLKVSELNKGNNKQSQYAQKLESLIGLLGIEGDDLDSKLTALDSKVKQLSSDLTKAQNTLTQAETAKTEAETKLAQTERKIQVQAAAAKSGAVPEVLEQLIATIPAEQVAFSDQGVTVEGKLLKEYAEANLQWKPFLPALFPSATPAPRLPTGSANGNTQKANPVDDYLTKSYNIPDYLKV